MDNLSKIIVFCFLTFIAISFIQCEMELPIKNTSFPEIEGESHSVKLGSSSGLIVLLKIEDCDYVILEYAHSIQLVHHGACENPKHQKK